MAKQSIDPALLALQTAKKAMPASPNTQAVAKPSLNVPKQQSQAISTNITPPVAKIGGISSPFGATNINSSPVLGGATPQEIGTVSKELQSLPNVIPTTGAEPIKKLSIDDFANKIKEKYPEYKDKDNKTLAEAMIKKYPEYKDKISMEDGNFITDLGSGIGQSVTGFGNLGKKLAFGAVDLYRQSQGKEKLTPEQRASAEQTPMGQALNTITNWQTPEEKASIGGQIGMVAGSVAQGAVLGTPLTSAIGKIPGAAQIATKAPILSKIAGGIGQGLEGQVQYSAAAEGKLPTSKELFTAGAFGGAVNAIGPIAKGIKDMKKPTAPFKETRNKIAEGIVGSNLKNPAMREKYISKVGQTPEKTLLDEGITGSLGKQATQVANKSKQAYDATRVALKSIPTQFKSDEGLWITNKILEGVDTSIPGIEDVIAPIKDMNTRFTNGSASAIDMNDAKLLLARYEGLYDDFGRVKKTGDEFEKKALAKMYDNMKTEIENIGEQYGMDIKSMNKETQKREGLRGLMDRAVSREAGRDMISLSDYMLGGITIVDPMTAIPLTLGKKFFSSPKVTSKIAKLLYSKGDDVIANSTNNASMNVANGATKQGLKYPIKLQQEGMQVGGATLPKPTPKTPPITVEKGAIGMGTPKVNNPPVIPPKATVAPVVPLKIPKAMPKLQPREHQDYIGEAKKIVKKNTPFVDKEQPMYIKAGITPSEIINGGFTKKAEDFAKKMLKDDVVTRSRVVDLIKAEASEFKTKQLKYINNILKEEGLNFMNAKRERVRELNQQFIKASNEKGDILAPKKGMPKLGKEIMEQNITQGDDLISEAKKYNSAVDMINSLEKEGKVLYHGTDANIDSFSNDFIGKGGDSQRREGAGLGKGIYLTNKLDEAKFYAKLVNEQNTNTRRRNDMGKHEENIMSQLKEGKITKAQAGDMFFNGPETPNGKENIIKTVIDGKLASKKDIKEIFGDNLPKKYIDDGFGKRFQIIDQEKINKLLKDKGFIGRSEPYTMAGQQLGGREMSDNIVIFDPASIKTESQLKQIREQANLLGKKK